MALAVNFQRQAGLKLIGLAKGSNSFWTSKKIDLIPSESTWPSSYCLPLMTRPVSE
jgi:hypothetical protein